MSCTFEDKMMINPMNELTHKKSIDSDKRVKTNQKLPNNLDLGFLSLQDNVNISSTSKELEALKASLMNEPEINAARVEYFKAEIEAGTYEVKSEHIARKMLSTLEEA